MRVCVCWMFGALGSPHANSFHIRFDQFPPHICVYVCVLSSFRVCASATYIIEKNTTSFFFLQSYGPLFHPVFPWRVLVCVCFHAFCFIALKGNAPEHPALLIPHTQTHATGLIQCLCGCPSGVVCKYSRDERTADENVPSALWIGWTQISVAFRDLQSMFEAQTDLGSDCSNNELLKSSLNKWYLLYTHTSWISSHAAISDYRNAHPHSQWWDVHSVREDLLSAEMCVKYRCYQEILCALVSRDLHH